MLSFVGVGPGDPELLTIRAVSALTCADVIAVPDSGAGECAALNIIGSLARGKPILKLIALPTISCASRRIFSCIAASLNLEIALLFLRFRSLLYAKISRRFGAIYNWQSNNMPMRPGEDWSPAHDRAAGALMARLKTGARIAYPVLGDPSLYASSIYLYRRIALHYPSEIIPGVPAMCAAAAALGVPLAERREKLTVLPGFREGEDLPEGAMVIMKAGRALDAILASLNGRSALLAKNLGMPGEYLGPLGSEHALETYFSLVLIRPETEP